MGYSRWSDDDWAGYSSSVRTKSVDEIYTTKGTMKDHLNPCGVKMRESRDSDLNPNSNAIIVALDVTGSMSPVLKQMATESLGVLFKEILDRKPVSDPHLMFMAVGDAEYDRCPLQVSQFEADNRIIDQLTDMYLEEGGGGNSYESYHLPWYFAALHTSIDCFEKRGKKGYLFTLGDEQSPGPLTKDQIKRFIGDEAERDYTAEEILQMVQRCYNVFHVIIEQGNHCRMRGVEEVKKTWVPLLGQNVIRLKDYTKLAEVIVSTIQVCEGADREKVASSWSGDTSLVVRHAVSDLTVAGSSSKGDVVRL